MGCYRGWFFDCVKIGYDGMPVLIYSIRSDIRLVKLLHILVKERDSWVIHRLLIYELSGDDVPNYGARLGRKDTNEIRTETLSEPCVREGLTKNDPSFYRDV